MKFPAASCRVSSNLEKVLAVIVDVRYFGDSLFDFMGIQKIAKINSESVKKRFNRIKGYEDSESVNKS